jgi:hypothetical protein
MSVKTDAQLSTSAATIKAETLPAANSATRIGQMLEDLTDSKVNKQDKKQYCFSVSQSGSSAPTVTVHLNQLSGTIAWTRSTTGTYVGTLIGAFLSGKVPIVEGFIRNGSSIGSSTLNTFILQRLTDNTVALGTFTNGTLTDGLLTNQYFELNVFN